MYWLNITYFFIYKPITTAHFPRTKYTCLHLSSSFFTLCFHNMFFTFIHLFYPLMFLTSILTFIFSLSFYETAYFLTSILRNCVFFTFTLRNLIHFHFHSNKLHTTSCFSLLFSHYNINCFSRFSRLSPSIFFTLFYLASVYTFFLPHYLFTFCLHILYAPSFCIPFYIYRLFRSYSSAVCFYYYSHCVLLLFPHSFHTLFFTLLFLFSSYFIIISSSFCFFIFHPMFS